MFNTIQVRSGSQKSIIYSLQGLRGIAALLVVCDHAIATLIAKAHAGVGSQEFGYFFGFIGVSIFFLISGVVMVHAHAKDFGQPGATVRFMGKRIGRIVPLYWLTSLIYYFRLVTTNDNPGLEQLVMSLLFIPHQDIGPTFGFPVYGVGWTLEFEMFFYLAFALAMRFRLWGEITLVVLMFTTVVLCGSIGVFGKDNILAYWSQPVVLYFVAGVAIGIGSKYYFGIARWRPNFYLSFTLALLFTGVACAMGYWRGPEDLGTLIVAPIASIAAVTVSAFSIETGNTGPAHSIAKSLGNSTYSIYLTHSFVLGPFGRLFGRYGREFPVVLIAALMFVASIIVGIATYKYLEKPLLRAWAAFFPPKTLAY